MSQLDEIEARANRHLDGMTVNRDAMARDVLKLCAALRRLQREVAKPATTSPHRNDVIDDIFGGIFR